MRKINYRVLLEPGGELLGDRVGQLLQTIDRLGSINRAAAELKMSYRHAWGLIKAAEERLSCSLLAKRVGGAAGGGAVLTDQGRQLLAEYEQVRAQVDAHVHAKPAAAETASVLLAATISPVETGLVTALAEAFLEETGIPLRHIAAGTGQALQLAREGRADVVLAHAPQLEQEFLADGYGTARYPLMHNDFLLVGPAADPAGTAGATSAADAFRRCAAAPAPFISRGDQSGTHVRELALWAAAGVTPAAPWYGVSAKGAMGTLTTLRQAEQEQAYILVDRATYLSAQAQGLTLALLVAGDPALRNEFVLMPVNPDRFPRAQHNATSRFVGWATGARGQDVIRQFGADRFGEPLFRPLDK